MSDYVPHEKQLDKDMYKANRKRDTDFLKVLDFAMNEPEFKKKLHELVKQDLSSHPQEGQNGR